MKNLNETLAYLNQLNPTEVDLCLTRILKVTKPLSLLDFNCPVITVAGTNGKGSVVKTLETIFTLAGYKVGAYTSPHILHFNERIRFCNAEISDDELLESLRYVEKHRESVSLSFFEFTTLAAFHFYQKMQPDLIILEVGMGGRLDAVNCVDPDISVITSIDFDHMEYLGTTLEEIGFEKAGIARPQKPLVFIDEIIPKSIVRHVAEIGAELLCAGKDFYSVIQSEGWSWKGVASEYLNLPMPHLKLQNVAGALMVVELLQNRLPVSIPAVYKGVAEVTLEGRFEYSNIPGLVFDVAHNPASAKWLAEQIKNRHPGGKKYAIFSMLKDKDISASIRPFIDLLDVWHISELNNVSRAETVDKISDILREEGVKTCYTFPAVSDAVSCALNEYDAKTDLIIIFGSFHTVEQAKIYLSGVNHGS